jgi:NDP-sugar pyrophosphorylase family protein
VQAEPADFKRNLSRNTQVVVIAGGRAKRMGIDIPKCLLEISGKKLIDRCIELLVGQGFREFVFLLGHRHELVTQHVGDGSRYGIKVKYSIDPETDGGWGKGKAFKYALLNGTIDPSRRSMVVFPDDLILEHELFSKFLNHHISTSERCNTIASTVLVPGTFYPYGVAEIDGDGLVTGFSEKPFIPNPTSVGVYLFEAAVYKTILDTISLEDPAAVDLESTVLPVLASHRKLSSYFIPSKNWISINTMKEYEQAVKILTSR